MKPDEHILEYGNGRFRLVILESDDDTGAKSVKDIIESSDLVDLLPYTTPGECVRISIPIELLPGEYAAHKLSMDHEAQLNRIREFHQAVIDAEAELKRCKAELVKAIHGDFNE